MAGEGQRKCQTNAKWTDHLAYGVASPLARSAASLAHRGGRQRLSKRLVKLARRKAIQHTATTSECLPSEGSTPFLPVNGATGCRAVKVTKCLQLRLWKHDRASLKQPTKNQRWPPLCWSFGSSTLNVALYQHATTGSATVDKVALYKRKATDTTKWLTQMVSRTRRGVATHSCRAELRTSSSPYAAHNCS